MCVHLYQEEKGREGMSYIQMNILQKYVMSKIAYILHG